MKLAIDVELGEDDQLIFAQQLGADGVFAAAADWGGDNLARISNRVRSAGLTLEGCAWPGRASRRTGIEPADPVDLEEIVEEGTRVIARAAACGIPLVACRWSPATAAGNNAWDAVARVAPRLGAAAASAGVRLALHWGHTPDSVGRDLTPPSKNLMRVLELSSSGNCGVDLVVGAMATTDEALATIRQLSAHIASVLLANHDGNSLPHRTVPLDQGCLDVVAVLGLLREMGFSGPVRATPGPKMVGDTQWGHKAHAHDLGFVRAVLQSLGATSGDRGAIPGR